MDLYSTYSLNGIVTRLRPVPQFFLSFFPAVIEHETEQVYFDRAEDKPGQFAGGQPVGLGGHRSIPRVGTASGIAAGSRTLCAIRREACLNRDDRLC